MGERDTAIRALNEYSSISNALAKGPSSWAEEFLKPPAVLSIGGPTGIVDSVPIWAAAPFRRLWTLGEHDKSGVQLTPVSWPLPTTLEELRAAWHEFQKMDLFIVTEMPEVVYRGYRMVGDGYILLSSTSLSIESAGLPLLALPYSMDSLLVGVLPEKPSPRFMLLNEVSDPRISDSTAMAVRRYPKPDRFGDTVMVVDGRVDAFTADFKWPAATSAQRRGFTGVVGTVHFKRLTSGDGLLLGLTFDERWPSLAAATAMLGSQPLTEIGRMLRQSVDRQEERVKVFGASLPLRGLAGWGAPVVVAIQLYLLLHLLQLCRIAGIVHAIPLVPWIAIYPETGARLFTTISVIALPFATIGALLIRTDSLSSALGAWLWFLWIISMLISSQTLFTFWELRQHHTEP